MDIIGNENLKNNVAWTFILYQSTSNSMTRGFYEQKSKTNENVIKNAYNREVLFFLNVIRKFL